MKIFGWKAAGRDDGRPVLSRYGSWSGAALGDWPSGYEGRVRAAYADNPIAQRAVKLVAEGLAGAPLTASDPALTALVTARSGGQALSEIVAAHLLLHGIRRPGSIASGWRWSRCKQVGSKVRSPMATRCAGAMPWRLLPRSMRAVCCA